MPLHVAVVTRDGEVRARAARSFDGAPQEWRITLDDALPPGADVVVAGPEADVPADLIYDGSNDLIAAVRRVAEARRCRRIHIGGLAGSGGTSVALHLCAALARSFSACLIDRDPLSGAAHRLLMDDALVCASDEDIRRFALPARGGFRVLVCPDPSVDAEGAAAAHFDVLVVDGGAPTSCDVAVLQPTVPQARRLRALLSGTRPPLVVTNRLGRGGSATRRDLERVLGLRIACELPHSPALRDAEDSGHLVPTWTRWWRGIERIANVLAR